MNRVAYTELITGDRFRFDGTNIIRLSGSTERVSKFRPFDWTEYVGMQFEFVVKDSQVYVYGIRHCGIEFSWAELRSFCRKHRIPTVPTMLQGLYSDNMVGVLFANKSIINGQSRIAGIVVRELGSCSRMEIRNDRSADNKRNP